jgi:hypothetical protein
MKTTDPLYRDCTYSISREEEDYYGKIRIEKNTTMMVTSEMKGKMGYEPLPD